MAMMLEVKNLSCGYGQKQVLENVSFSADSGQILCLLGPNGVGKTTLFKAILGIIKLQSGRIWLDGRPQDKLSISEIARLVAYVPQYHTPPFPFSVREVVSTGRTAHIGRFSSPGKRDEAIVDQALEALHITDLADEIYTQISGGERQMVMIARALAQQPKIMVLDEPTSNLDFGNQIKVLEEIKRLAGQGLCIVMTTHFPNHAFICQATVLLLQRNREIRIGSSDEIITEQNIKDAYGVDSRITSVLDNRGNWVKDCVPLANAWNEGKP